MVLTSQPPYPNKFKTGDIAIATQNIDFVNGKKHVKGQEIVVTEKTSAYYNVWHHIYQKKGLA